MGDENRFGNRGGGISLMEFGALKERVNVHAERLDSLERRIEKGITDLSTRFDTFFNQYTKDQLLVAVSGGQAKGAARVKHAIITAIITLLSSGVFAALLAKLLGLHLVG